MASAKQIRREQRAIQRTVKSQMLHNAKQNDLENAAHRNQKFVHIDHAREQQNFLNTSGRIYKTTFQDTFARLDGASVMDYLKKYIIK